VLFLFSSREYLNLIVGINGCKKTNVQIFTMTEEEQKGMKERETICVVYLLLQLALIKTVFVVLYIIVL